MPEKHPYANVDGALIQLLDQLRKSFPAAVDAGYVKKLALAPKNESYLLNVIRFLGLIDENDKQTDQSAKTFTLHEDHEFQAAFADIVRAAYKGLFDIHKEDTWNLPDNKLIAFFRQTDHSSELVGTRQAKTFRFLAAYVGKSKEPNANQKHNAAKKSASTKVAKAAPKQNGQGASPARGKARSDEADHRVALSVKIEVNLPAGGDQDTYDRIFKSIRENLMNG